MSSASSSRPADEFNKKHSLQSINSASADSGSSMDSRENAGGNMLFDLGCAVRQKGSTFFNEAGEVFDTPRHPWLGVAIYLISAFALGSLLSEAWRASGIA
jgi:hypothetical protein